MINFEVETKVIPDSQRIWIVFSGIRRQYFEHFLQDSVIYLDYPELGLNHESLTDFSKIRQHVRMSNAIAEHQSRDSTKNPPSPDPGQYSGEPFKERSSTIKAGNVRRLYDSLKVGDLVIVPGSAFNPVLFGEVSQNFNPNLTIMTQSRGSPRKVQYRKVKWYRTDVIRSDLPQILQVYLSKPPAIANVPRDSKTERFFHFAYDSYILRQHSFELFRAPLYQGNDPRATEDANRLITYFSAAYCAIEKDKLSDFINLEFEQAIDKFFDDELIEAYSQVFKSPGQIGMLSAAIVMGGFVSICTNVATSSLTHQEIHSGVEITNSIDSKNYENYKKALEDKINPFLKSLSKKELKNIQNKGYRSKQKLGLTSKAKLK